MCRIRFCDERAAVTAQIRHALTEVQRRAVQLIEVMTAVDRTYTPEDLERMNEQRQRATADLTPQQRAEMDERRRQFRAQLSPEQLADMHRRRANGGVS